MRLFLLFLIIAFALTSASAQQSFIVFPDTQFKSALVNQPSIDANGDGEIQLEEALQVTKLDLTQRNIKSIEGISYFSNLSTLFCSRNEIGQLDLSKNTSLETLLCDFNKLEFLDLSKNIALRQLDCSSNKITSIDISHNKQLFSFDCGSNAITSLNLAENLNLERLGCQNNPIENLQLTHLQNLTRLLCINTLLDNPDLSKNLLLSYLSIGGKNITIIDVSNNIGLQAFFCDSSAISSLDLSHNQKLYIVKCTNSLLENLVMPASTSLHELYLQNNLLKTIDLRSINRLIFIFDCTRNVPLHTICINEKQVSNIGRDDEYVSWKTENGSAYKSDCQNITAVIDPIKERERIIEGMYTLDGKRLSHEVTFGAIYLVRYQDGSVEKKFQMEE